MVDWMTRRFRVLGFGFRVGRPESQVDASVSGFGFPVSSVEPYSPDLSPDHVSLARSDLDTYLYYSGASCQVLLET